MSVTLSHAVVWDLIFLIKPGNFNSNLTFLAQTETNSGHNWPQYYQLNYTV
jgi:hypothetical protein